MGTDTVTDLLGVDVELFGRKGRIRAVAPREYGWSLLIEFDRDGLLRSYNHTPADDDLKVLP